MEQIQQIKQNPIGELIKQYQGNQKGIEKINNSLDELRTKNEKETYNLQYEIYQDRIRALQDERDNKISELHKQFNEKANIKNQEREKLEGVIFKVRRIIEFLKIEKTDLNFRAYSYNGYEREKNFLKPIDTISDDFKKIQVFIYGNGKPKNKFALCVVGMTIFNKDFLELPKSYLSINKEDGYFNIEKWIKDLPTEKELKIYYEKNKDKILKDFLEEHKKIEKEYLNILENYSIEDFEELFDVKCKCGFCLLNKNSYHLDIDDEENLLCPNCKGVLKERK